MNEKNLIGVRGGALLTMLLVMLSSTAQKSFARQVEQRRPTVVELERERVEDQKVAFLKLSQFEQKAVITIARDIAQGRTLTSDQQALIKRLPPEFFKEQLLAKADPRATELEKIIGGWRRLERKAEFLKLTGPEQEVVLNIAKAVKKGHRLLTPDDQAVAERFMPEFYREQILANADPEAIELFEELQKIMGEYRTK